MKKTNNLKIYDIELDEEKINLIIKNKILDDSLSFFKIINNNFVIDNEIFKDKKNLINYYNQLLWPFEKWKIKLDEELYDIISEELSDYNWKKIIPDYFEPITKIFLEILNEKIFDNNLFSNNWLSLNKDKFETNNKIIYNLLLALNDWDFWNKNEFSWMKWID